MRYFRPIIWVLTPVVFSLLAPAAFGMSVALAPSTPSPAPVGTVITWTATVLDGDSGVLWYRFRAARAGQPMRTVRDFGPSSAFDWTASDYNGAFEIEVTARNLDSGESITSSQVFEMNPRVITGGEPEVFPTSHPLVYLYSAPPCAAGSRMQVEFRRTAGGAAQRTPFRDCQTGFSVNFYLGGLRASTEYTARHILQTGTSLQPGPAVEFTTGDAPDSLAKHTVVNGPAPAGSEAFLLEATLFSNPVATDTEGSLVWYYPADLSFLTRPSGQGRFFGIVQTNGADKTQQLIREFDLTGMTLRETNAARVSEQLVAMGKRPIGGFHHEARVTPDGRIVALASVEQILSGVQGPDAVNIVGDMIVVMDSNLQVVWAWDAFDHLDVTRKATLDDKCSPGSCAPMYLARSGNDWTHGNSVQQTPDGALLYSSRSQDWVIKIDYANGSGGGNILWRLGKDGDFRFASQDPYPWFSHQHDPQILADNTSLLVFDNGNVRTDTDPAAHSRGQLIYLDEANRTASLQLNADLGFYSFALGSAQALSDGNYHFETGFLPDATSMAFEVDPQGNPVYTLHGSAPAYRSFRMPDLYTW